MIWFSGTIKSAIDKVKSSNCLLFVFIEGEDELSKKYNSFLKEETSFKPEHYIAIKIPYNSVAFHQFKKIYVTVPVPSVFLIGTNGMPLGVVCSKEPSDLCAAFSEVLANHKHENSVKNHVNENSHGQNNNNNNLPSRNHRETCQDYEFYPRRDNVLRFEQRYATCPQLLHSEYPCEHTCSIPTIQSARIQFRLPTNEIRSWEFPDMCTLNDVKLYLMETMKLSSGFKLLRTYPRIAFSPQDEDKTLSDLSLTPNATLIVVPLQDDALQSKMKRIISKRNIVLSLMTVIFRPIFMIIDYFKNIMNKSTELNKAEPGKKKRHYVTRRRLERSAYGSNVHGFNFDESSDSDADMNTDNGNSTQQK